MVTLIRNLLLALMTAGALLFLLLMVRSAPRANPAEPPGNAGLARIPELFELWNETLGYAIFALALFGGAWLILRAHWGLETAWDGEAWMQVDDAIGAFTDFEVREPGESWKANLIWGCIIGLPFGLSALLTGGKWTAARAFWTVVGFGIFLWMVQFSVENYSRTVRLSAAGLEERSIFRSRRVPWDQIGGLEFQDVRAQIQSRQDWQTRRSSTLPRIDIWVLKDRRGSEILSLPAAMEPGDAFQKMRERIQRRTSAR